MLPVDAQWLIRLIVPLAHTGLAAMLVKPSVHSQATGRHAKPPGGTPGYHATRQLPGAVGGGGGPAGHNNGTFKTTKSCSSSSSDLEWVEPYWCSIRFAGLVSIGISNSFSLTVAILFPGPRLVHAIKSSAHGLVSNQIMVLGPTGSHDTISMRALEDWQQQQPLKTRHASTV